MKMVSKNAKWTAVLVLMALFICGTSLLFGHQVIQSMYDGESIGVLNSLICYQHKHPVEHYYRLADRILLATLSIICSGVMAWFLVYRLLCAKKSPNIILLFLLAVSILIFIFLLSPNGRIYSHHGFLHSAVVYQIMNGNVPPNDPLLAGVPIHYPWGPHFIIAKLSEHLNLAPFQTYAVVNVVYLVIVMYCIYRISQSMISNKRAGALSVLISLFSITPLFRLSAWAGGLMGAYLDHRTVPLFRKFTYISNGPIGILLFVVFLYSLIKFFDLKKPLLHGSLLVISILGCCFCYPLMLPGFISTLVLAIVFIFAYEYKKGEAGFVVKKAVVLTVLCAISVLVMLPYMFSIMGGDSGSKIGLFVVNAMYANSLTVLFFLTPILAICFFGRQFLFSHLNAKPALVCLAGTVSCMACYVFLHMFKHAEYKCLILANMCIGIFGGIAFYGLSKKRPRIMVFVLLLLLFPNYTIIERRVRLGTNWMRHKEVGVNLIHNDPIQESLYRWIRQNCSIDSVFIDTRLDIPVFAQRPLYLGMDGGENGKAKWTRGYKIPIKVLWEQSQYDVETLESRKQIVERVFDYDDSFSEEFIKQLSSISENTYIVVRDSQLVSKFSRKCFDPVFSTSNNDIVLFRVNF